MSITDAKMHHRDHRPPGELVSPHSGHEGKVRGALTQAGGWSQGQVQSPFQTMIYHWPKRNVVVPPLYIPTSETSNAMHTHIEIELGLE
jgi:hypothetical protein